MLCIVFYSKESSIGIYRTLLRNVLMPINFYFRDIIFSLKILYSRKQVMIHKVRFFEKNLNMNQFLFG